MIKFSQFGYGRREIVFRDRAGALGPRIFMGATSARILRFDRQRFYQEFCEASPLRALIRSQSGAAPPAFRIYMLDVRGAPKCPRSGGREYLVPSQLAAVILMLILFETYRLLQKRCLFETAKRTLFLTFCRAWDYVPPRLHLQMRQIFQAISQISLSDIQSHSGRGYTAKSYTCFCVRPYRLKP